MLVPGFAAGGNAVPFIPTSRPALGVPTTAIATVYPPCLLYVLPAAAVMMLLECPFMMVRFEGLKEMSSCMGCLPVIGSFSWLEERPWFCHISVKVWMPPPPFSPCVPFDPTMDPATYCVCVCMFPSNRIRVRADMMLTAPRLLAGSLTPHR